MRNFSSANFFKLAAIKIRFRLDFFNLGFFHSDFDLTRRTVFFRLIIDFLTT